MFINQPYARRLEEEEHPYSSSLPTVDHGFSLLTSSFNPNFMDDQQLSSSLPPNSSNNNTFIDENEWFNFPSHQDDMDLFSTNNNQLDSTLSPLSSAPPLTHNYSPQSEMSSMVSPLDNLQPMHSMINIQDNNNSNNNNNNNNEIPIHEHQDKIIPMKGHRRRRSSSVPSLFYSIKKHMPMSPVYDTNQDPIFVPPLPQPQQSTSTSLSSLPPPPSSNNHHHHQNNNHGQPYMIYYPQHPHPFHHQQQQQQQDPSMKKLLPIKIQRKTPPMKQNIPTPLNQQQLDEKLLRLNFNDVTVAELKEYLRERNLSVAGRKAELANRLFKEKQRISLMQIKKKDDKNEIKEEIIKEEKRNQKSVSLSPQHYHSTTTPTSNLPLVSSQQNKIISPIDSPHIHHLTHQINNLAFQSSQPIDSQQQQQQQRFLSTSPSSSISSMNQSPLLNLQQQPFSFSFDDMYLLQSQQDHSSDSSHSDNPWSKQQEFNMFQYF